MTTSKQKIRERVRKLLALSRNNPNKNEADTARAQAEKLIQEHGLKGAKEKEVAPSGSWELELLKAIAAKHGCTIVEGPEVRIKGTKAACAAVREEHAKMAAQYRANQYARLEDLLAQVAAVFDPFAWVDANVKQRRTSPTTKRKKK